MILYCPVRFRKGIVSGKLCTGKQNAHCRFSIFFFKNNVIYELTWKNMVDTDRPQMNILYVACALHAGYVRGSYRKS